MRVKEAQLTHAFNRCYNLPSAGQKSKQKDFWWYHLS